MFFVRSLLVAVFALGSLSPLFAGGGDSFAGGLVGGLTGGMVAGAMNKGSGDSRSSREAEQLRRERDQEKMEELRRSVETQKQSGDKFMLYVLFFVVFGLLIAVGALGYFVLRK